MLSTSQRNNPHDEQQQMNLNQTAGSGNQSGDLVRAQAPPPGGNPPGGGGPPGQPPGAGGYGPPGYGPPGGPPGGPVVGGMQFGAHPVYQQPAPDPELQKRADKWFALSIFSIFCGCWILGVVALILTSGAKTAIARGNFADAENKIQTAKILCIIGWSLFGLLIAFYIVYAVLIGAAILNNLGQINS